MDIDKLKQLLAINKNSLDDEISRQPMLFYEVAEACVAAAAERDARKEDLATIDAELDGLSRTLLSRREEKVTEAMVKNTIQTNAKHEAAFNAYMQAKTESDLLSAMKDAFGQRGYMLRDMAQLYVASYFEQSSVQGNNNTDKVVYEARRDQAAKMRKERVRA